MATHETYNVQIKRYNANNDWDIINPKTKVANITDANGNNLQDLLDGKELLSNKVTSISSSSDNTHYPSALAVYTQIQNVREVAEGKTANYVTYHTNNATEFNSTSDTVSIAATKEITYYAPDGQTYTKKISEIGLNIGDVFFVVETLVPDRWFSEIDNSVSPALYKFSKLETTAVNLAPYITAVSYDSSSHKITYTKASGSTDVVDLDDFASLNNSTGAISIGGVTKTPLYAHLYRPIQVGGTEALANDSSTALNFKNTGNVQFTYDNAGGLEVNFAVNSQNANIFAPTSAGSSGQYLKSNGSNNAPTWETSSNVYTATGTALFNQAGAFNLYKAVARTSVGGTAPDTKYAGDIWFDTTS